MFRRFTIVLAITTSKAGRRRYDVGLGVYMIHSPGRTRVHKLHASAFSYLGVCNVQNDKHVRSWDVFVRIASEKHHCNRSRIWRAQYGLLNHHCADLVLRPDEQWCGDSTSGQESLQARLVEFATQEWGNRTFLVLMASILCDIKFELCEAEHAVSSNRSAVKSVLLGDGGAGPRCVS